MYTFLADHQLVTVYCPTNSQQMANRFFWELFFAVNKFLMLITVINLDIILILTCILINIRTIFKNSLIIHEPNSLSKHR